MNTLLNGKPSEHISIDDRGFQYGDGVFETVRITDNNPILWAAHQKRLVDSCERLGIKLDLDLVNTDIAILLSSSPSSLSIPARTGILKIIITRGRGGRGYQPSVSHSPNRILQFHPLDNQDDPRSRGISIRLCQHTISINPATAGLKHLNRLDQVIASAELAQDYDEGLLLDPLGNLIEATKSNVFMVQDGRVLTPDLSHSGVAGIMRQHLMQRFIEQDIAVSIEKLSLQHLYDSSEVFLCNSVFGVWPVLKMCENDTVSEWSVGPITLRAIDYQHEVFSPSL